MIRIAIAMSFVLVSGTARAQDISFILVEDTNPKDKEIITTRSVQKVVPQTRTVTVNVDGKPQTRTEVITATVNETVSVTVPLKAAKGYDGDGQRLNDEQMWQRLKAGTTFVLVRNGTLEPAALRLFRKDATIVVLPGK